VRFSLTAEGTIEGRGRSQLLEEGSPLEGERTLDLDKCCHNVPTLFLETMIVSCTVFEELMTTHIGATPM
jgi:hypothetical protein